MLEATTRRSVDAAAPVLMHGWKPELTASIGAFVGLATGLPAILVALAWLSFAPGLIQSFVAGALPADVQSQSEADRSLAYSMIDKLAGNVDQLNATDISVLRQGGDPAVAVI